MTKRITIKTHDDALDYLCSINHDGRYLKEDDDGKLFFEERVTCRRCGGAGYYPSQFHGACYECNGRPPNYIVRHSLIAIAKKARKAELAAAARERKNEKREAEFVEAANEKRADFDASFPGFAAKLEGATNTILIDLGEKLAKWGSLSPAQVAFAEKLLEEAAAPKTALEGGKREVTGTVISCKWRSSQWGGAYKVTLDLGDGTRIWGSLASVIEDAVSDHYYKVETHNRTFDLPEVIKGATVSFSATISPSDDDVSFGFFKRPTKGTLDALTWTAPEPTPVDERCEFCDGNHHSHDCPAEAHHCEMMER